MRGRRLFTVDQLEVALRAQAGIQSAAAKALSDVIGQPVSPQVVSYNVLRHPRLREAIRQAQDFTLDMAESVMLQALQAGDVNVAKFYLETLGKGRGFTKRIEMTGKDGGALVVALPAQVAEARRRNEQLLDEVAMRVAAVENADPVLH
jgi:hypothetical protein